MFKKSTMLENYDFGIIGNGRTSALIDDQGTFIFCCLPDFDSGTAMAALLDSEKGGHFGISLEDGEVIEQSYEPNTNIFYTIIKGSSGTVKITDFMPRIVVDDRHRGYENITSDVVRVIEAVEGTPEIIVDYSPQLEYAKFPTTTTVLGDQLLKSVTEGTTEAGTSLYESLYLHTDLPVNSILTSEKIKVVGKHFCLMSYHDKIITPTMDSVQMDLSNTLAYWQNWSAHTFRPSCYTEEVLRSALTLKMLQYSPSGAFVAAATTSLPESIGEERNWDYRFCWIRDASMTVSTLTRIGHPMMASRFVDYVFDTIRTKDDSLQIMYGLRGERDLTEETLSHLSGYCGSKPVRVGNAAYNQQQHDIYGVLLDVIYQDLQHRPRKAEALDRIWTHVRSVVQTVEKTWMKPDKGIWEFRGEERHFVFSKVLCWVAIDRAIKIAELLNKNNWAEKFIPLRDTIHQSVCENGWSDKLGAFKQAYETEALDASNLLIADYGFLDGSDPRFIATVEQCREHLSEGCLIFRYKNEDDFGEPSSAFTVCSFWLVKALAHCGKKELAKELFEELLSYATKHGLYGEDLDFKSKRHLGNFPQAYSHLALIDCALLLEPNCPV